MTSLRNPVRVDISFNTTSVSQAGFGRPIFAAPHIYFPERVRGYPSLEAANADIPADTQTHRALQTAFSQQPSPDIVYVGRQEVSQVTLTPDPVGNSTVYSFTAVLDGETTLVTFTSDSDATADEISEGLLSEVSTGLNSEATFSASVSGGSLVLSGLGAVNLQITALSNLTDTYVSTESASELVNALSDENSDWYFITAQDHSQEFVLAMAAAIEPLEKIYFTSSSDVANLVTLGDPVETTDTFGRLKDGNFSRTVALFHQDADSIYPELGYVSINAPYDAGSVVWANVIPAGFGVSRNTAQNNRSLTFTERNNLNSKSANWVENLGGNPILRRGTASSGRFIDQTRGRDWLLVETRVELQRLLLNQRGRKIPFTSTGLAQVESAISNAWRRGVARSFLEGYVIRMPTIATVSPNDRSNYFLRGIQVTGFLAGAIIEIEMQGSLEFSTTGGN